MELALDDAAAVVARECCNLLSQLAGTCFKKWSAMYSPLL
jgi:hypothetical protein